jgi:hypothetical protein
MSLSPGMWGLRKSQFRRGYEQQYSDQAIDEMEDKLRIHSHRLYKRLIKGEIEQRSKKHDDN